MTAPPIVAMAAPLPERRQLPRTPAAPGHALSPSCGGDQDQELHLFLTLLRMEASRGHTGQFNKILDSRPEI